MAHKKKMDEKKEPLPYTIQDALQITDDIFKLSKEKKYNMGAFVHGLILALEYAQFSYSIPQQQIAGIKRDCRRYFKNMDTIKK
ncbi:MAG: hypothetical protein JSW60_08630 [Thermoplasmatales archaeon]|nr:MAG: hypothetical protein JSW60_08630 [Thermoplasmatales archaeon]